MVTVRFVWLCPCRGWFRLRPQTPPVPHPTIGRATGVARRARRGRCNRRGGCPRAGPPPNPPPSTPLDVAPPPGALPPGPARALRPPFVRACTSPTRPPRAAAHGGCARSGRELPKDLAGLGIEGAELAVVGAAREQQTATGGEHGAPIERWQVGGPHLFSAVEVPRLQFADVVGAGNHLHHVFRDSHEALALHVFGRFAGEFGAQVVVGGNVE